MQEEYKYFTDEKEDEINKEFSEQVDFQTNVRGFKLRGCYDTMREAQVRSEILKRKDKQHNIYITQVGCWCPWDPNPNDIQDQHYAEDQLNTLMKKYRENQQQKDDYFATEQRERSDAVKRDGKDPGGIEGITVGGKPDNLNDNESEEKVTELDTAQTESDSNLQDIKKEMFE